MPDCAGRKRAKAKTKDVPDDSLEEPVKGCEDSPIPVLTGLEVIAGALVGVAPGYWTTLSAVAQVQVRATTRPDDAAGITWDGAGHDVAARRQDVSRAAVGDFVVGALLNCPRVELQIKVWNLVSVVSDLPIAVAGNTRKGYAGFIPGNIATLTAATNPDNATVWAQLGWSAGNAGVEARLRTVDVTAVGDQNVTVTLGTPAIGPIQLPVLLHICQWPLLEVSVLTFSRGHVINNDTVGNFGRHWYRNRIGAVQPNLFNYPQCYTRHTVIALSARLRVVTAPTDTETVQVRGRATIGGTVLTWTSGNIAVRHGDAEVRFPAAVDSDNPLPDQVNHYAAAQIDWEMSQPDGTWLAIGNTQHDIYATLGDPVGRAYLTLLHYSCVNGAATNSEAAFVPAAYASYTGRNMRRQRDNKPMTYWDPRDVAGGNGNTAALLGSDSRRQDVSDDQVGLAGLATEQVAVGHCGSWAESFVDMLKIHGVTSGHKVNVTARAGPLPRAVVPVQPDAPDGGFMVATWDFTALPALRRDALTHDLWVTATPGVYAPGQSNPTPPPAFFNHFVVWCTSNSTLYDPSYGTVFHGATRAATLLAWELASISGLFSNDGLQPSAGFATGAAPPPGRRLRFADLVAGADL